MEHSVVKSKKRDVWNGAVCYGQDRHRNTHKSTQTHTQQSHGASHQTRLVHNADLLELDVVVGRVDTIAKVLRKRRRK